MGAYLCHAKSQHIKLSLTYTCKHYLGQGIIFISHHALFFSWFYTSTNSHMLVQQKNLSCLLGKKNTGKKLQERILICVSQTSPYNLLPVYPTTNKNIFQLPPVQ